MRRLAILLVLTGCGDVNSHRSFEIGLDDSLLPALEDMPIGREEMATWFVEDLGVRGYERKPGLRQTKSITLPGRRQIRYCKDCVGADGSLLWITSHEIVHSWQFEERFSLVDYADPTTRVGLEFQAARFQMRVAALVGWLPQAWHGSALEMVEGASPRGLTDREREFVSMELTYAWDEAWVFADPHYLAPWE